MMLFPLFNMYLLRVLICYCHCYSLMRWYFCVVVVVAAAACSIGDGPKTHLLAFSGALFPISGPYFPYFCGEALSVPNVSRERRGLQRSSEQLTQKTKIPKNLNFRPRKAREFFGRWDKNSNTARMQKLHTSGVCLREDKTSRIINGTIIRIFEICVLRILVA